MEFQRILQLVHTAQIGKRQDALEIKRGPERDAEHHCVDSKTS